MIPCPHLTNPKYKYQVASEEILICQQILLLGGVDSSTFINNFLNFSNVDIPIVVLNIFNGDIMERRYINIKKDGKINYDGWNDYQSICHRYRICGGNDFGGLVNPLKVNDHYIIKLLVGIGLQCPLTFYDKPNDPLEEALDNALGFLDCFTVGNNELNEMVYNHTGYKMIGFEPKEEGK